MLREHIGDAKTVTLIGLCKNAGKTTALRQLISELTDQTIALTSVGRDGEGTDLVTGTEKPELYIPAGALFATARGMLPLCDVTCAVEGLTDVMTPLGVVGIFRANSDGFVQLAGPSASGQLAPLAEQFFALGADRVLIDGAAGRKSLASAGTGAMGCTILCTGASAERNMDNVVADTAYFCALFASTAPENKNLSTLLGTTVDKFALFTPDGDPRPLPLNTMGTPNWSKLPKEPLAIWVGGAISDPLVKALAHRGAPTTLITENATHVLASRDTMAVFWRKGGQLSVRQPLTLAAVCANPWSAYGYHFPEGDFMKKLREAIPLPIINVEQEVK